MRGFAHVGDVCPNEACAELKSSATRQLRQSEGIPMRHRHWSRMVGAVLMRQSLRWMG